MAYVKKIIEGNEMWLDYSNPGISDELNRKGGREFAFMWILREESAGCKYALDIGANIGYTTIPLMKNCEKVFAFEPDHRSRKLLKKNIHEDHRVKVFASVVSDGCKSVRFKMSKKPNQSSVALNGTKVDAVSLDSLSDLDGSMFLKMDVEGHEIEVIKGGERQLSLNYPRKLLIELHKQKGRNYNETWAWLTSNGYYLKYVVNAKGMRDKMQGCPVYEPENYERSVYNAFDGCEEMCSQLIEGKKVIRGVLWVKE